MLLLITPWELQIHFMVASNLWWDLQNAPLTIVQEASVKKFSKTSQKGQKYKCQFTTFQMEFFENFCIFGILRYGFPIEISISELFGHFCFWPLSYGGLSVFLTGLA